MSKALSVDLRERVVAAIEAGSSCRAAASRFGVGISSAIRWASLKRAVGSVAPGPLGGDRRSGRVEAHAPLILGLLERTPDITLSELREELAEAGVPVGVAKTHAFDRRPLAPIAAGVIPPGCYYVQGLSPDSFDSRYRESGLVRAEQVIGVVDPIF